MWVQTTLLRELLARQMLHWPALFPDQDQAPRSWLCPLLFWGLCVNICHVITVYVYGVESDPKIDITLYHKFAYF